MSSSTGTYRILVADGNPLVTRFLRTVLNSHRHYVVVVNDIPGAQHELQENKFSVLFLDLDFPGDTSLEFLRVVRSGGSQMGVILTSTRPIEFFGESFKDFERVKFLQKPFNPSDLLRELEGVTGKIKT